jgi:ferritin-like metal-binding protein YciE
MSVYESNTQTISEGEYYLLENADDFIPLDISLPAITTLEHLEISRYTKI